MELARRPLGVRSSFMELTGRALAPQETGAFIVAQVRETVGFLRHPKVETPEVDLDEIALDPPTMAAQLASGADDLDGVLVGVNEAEKRADVTRQAKNEVIATENTERCTLPSPTVSPPHRPCTPQRQPCTGSDRWRPSSA